MALEDYLFRVEELTPRGELVRVVSIPTIQSSPELRFEPPLSSTQVVHSTAQPRAGNGETAAAMIGFFYLAGRAARGSYLPAQS